MASTRERNVILGLCDGLSYSEVAPFVGSLRQTAYSGEVVLFVAGADARTHAFLKSEGVDVRAFRRLRFHLRGRVVDLYNRRLRPIQPMYPKAISALTLASRDRLRTRSRLAAIVSVPYIARFLRFYDFLVTRPTNYRNVMLTDVRDVFFISDPFAQDLGQGVHCFLEDRRHTLGSEPRNHDWLARGYGERIAAELADRPISCSGITIGDTASIVEYLRAMTEALLDLPRQPDVLDQAVHNFLLHRAGIPNAHLVANGEGPVLTLALVPGDEVGTTVDAAVVHQYDRHPQLAEALLARINLLGVDQQSS